MTSRYRFGARLAGIGLFFMSVLAGVHVLGLEGLGPKFVMKETSFAQREVREGEVVERVVQVFNQGDQPLEIKEVRRDCGCTVVSFDKTIPPDGEGKIVIRVNTKGLLGQMRQTATVYTNDPEKPIIFLSVTALVKPVITLSRQYLNFYGKKGQRLTGEVEITAKIEKPLTLRPIQFNLDDKLKYRLEEIENGRRFRVRFESIPGITENFRGFLKLRTNYREKPDVTIYIWGRFAKKG